MSAGKTAGIILLVLSAVPLAFLAYTLTHLKDLQITILHPRVMVEFFIFLAAVITGIILVSCSCNPVS